MVEEPMPRKARGSGPKFLPEAGLLGSPVLGNTVITRHSLSVLGARLWDEAPG